MEAGGGKEDWWQEKGRGRSGRGGGRHRRRELVDKARDKRVREARFKERGEGAGGGKGQPGGAWKQVSIREGTIAIQRRRQRTSHQGLVVVVRGPLLERCRIP